MVAFSLFSWDSFRGSASLHRNFEQELFEINFEINFLLNADEPVKT
jgi:hypothetical protein